MKNIILLLTIFLFFSCRKEIDKPLSNYIQNSKTILGDTISYGDKLISQYDFVNQLKDNVDIKLQRAIISKIKFDYEKFANWNLNTNEEYKLGSLYLKFKKSEKQKPDADIYTIINLATYKNDKKIDELIVYKEENYSEALVALNQYFYLDNNNLWTLGITEDEEGIKVTSWNQYKIDNNSGKINSIKINSYNDSTPKNTKDNNWTGDYSFEKSNRDDLKTSFKISINDLSNINIVYVSDGEKTETYSGLVGKIVGTNKIEIVFNKKYDEMGVIYIQKDNNDFTISGSPISTINPGNNEYPLKKID